VAQGRAEAAAGHGEAGSVTAAAPINVQHSASIEDVLAGRARWALAVGDCRDVMATMPAASVDAVPCDPPYELGFMGKRWDASGVAFDPLTWAAALRVAKPGAHLAAFGGTRTFHRMTCAIEDASWEIRDCLSWLYGQGFPKSLQGPWGGTALKPAWEPVILARKPLGGTVAATFAEYGTGGINVDACRIPSANPPKGYQNGPGGKSHHYSSDARSADVRPNAWEPPDAGRWPANVILDEEAAAALDEQSGIWSSAPGGPARGDRARGHVLTEGDAAALRGNGGRVAHADAGGASRFFYVAKPSTAEREAGTEGLPKRAAAELVDREEDAAAMNSPRTGAGRTSDGRANFHPTVKPLALCRWLVRLICPVGGVVLDPFCGSGTMGAAAMMEGRRYIGCELTEEYLPIAMARIAHWEREHAMDTAQGNLFGGAA